MKSADLVSSWNMAGAYMLALREILDRINNAAFEGDFASYYKALDILKRELTGKLTTEEKEIIKEKMKVAKVSLESSFDQDLIYDNLSSCDETMREVLERAGLLTPKGMEPGDALL